MEMTLRHSFQLINFRASKQNCWKEPNQNLQRYRLPKAFTKRTSLLGDLRAALDYRQIEEDPEKFFGIMKKMVDCIVNIFVE